MTGRALIPDLYPMFNISKLNAIQCNYNLISFMGQILVGRMEKEQFYFNQHEQIVILED